MLTDAERHHARIVDAARAALDARAGRLLEVALACLLPEALGA